MQNELVEKLALIYVQAHTDASTTPAQIYNPYIKAAKEIRTAESSAYKPSL